MIEFAGAVLVGYGLIRRQSSLTMPLLPVDLFKRPVFALSVTTAVCTFVAQGIAFVALPFYFQDVIGRSFYLEPEPPLGYFSRAFFLPLLQEFIRRRPQSKVVRRNR